MKNFLVLLVSCGLFTSLLAEQPKIVRRQLTPEQKARMQQTMLERTGGLMVIPGKGKFLFVNTIGDDGQKLIEGQLPILRKMLRSNLQMTNSVFSIATAQENLAKFNANALVYLVSDPILPATLLSLEAKWGLVNVQALAADKPARSVLEARMRKSLLRTMTHVLGGSSSINKASAMRMATSLAGLDAVQSEVIATDNLIPLYKNMPLLGMSQNKLTTYKKACEEGWAPAPTNQYQKVIWERAKSDKERGPTNPIKIEAGKKTAPAEKK